MLSEDKLVFCNGLVLHRFQCLRGFGEWLDSIRDFSTHLQSLNLDASAFACLAALVLLTGEDNTRAPRLPPPHRTWFDEVVFFCVFFLREYTNSSQSDRREIWCDDHRVDTMTKATHTHTHTLVCCCLQKEPDTQQHLLHLPHTWLSNQFAAVRNTLAAFLHERKVEGEGACQ